MRASRPAVAACGAIGVAAGIVPGVGLVPAASAEAVQPEPESSPQLQYLIDTYGFDSERARLALDREALAEELVARLTDARLQAAWGGAWIDHANGSTVHLAVTTEAARRALTRMRLPSFVVVDRVRFTIEDLRRQRDEFRAEALRRYGERVASMADATEELSTDGPGAVGWSASIAIESNSVAVQVETGTLLEGVSRQIVEASGSLAAVEVDSVPVAPTLQETSSGTCLGPTHDCFPMMGGLEVSGLNGGGTCTAGFTFESNGARFASTAGHCEGSPWTHNGKEIGPKVWTKVAKTYDTKMITIVNPNAWKATNLVYRPNNDIRITSKITNPDNSLIGITVCQTGVGKVNNNMGAESCGPLTSVDGQFGSWKDPEWDQMGVARYRSCRGDSGGPVFNPDTGRAYGLNRGRSGPVPIPVCTIGGEGGYESMFSWVSNIETASGYMVLLAS